MGRKTEQSNSSKPIVPPSAPKETPRTTGPQNEPIQTDALFTRRVLMAVGITLAAVLLAVLILYTAEILTLLFASVLMAVFLSAPTDLLAKYARIGRGYALGMVLVTLACLASLFFFALGRTVYTQVQVLKVSVPRALRTLERDVQNNPWLQRFAPPATVEEQPLVEAASTETATAKEEAAGTAPATIPATRPRAPSSLLADWLARFRDLLTELVTSERFYSRAGGAVSATAGVIGNMVLIFAIGLFLAISPQTYISGFVALFPIQRRLRARQVLARVGETLEWWFVGQLASMTAVGVLTSIGLLILGVPAALTLGILAGLLTFVPNFGPIIAAIPAVLLAFAPHPDQVTLNPKAALYVIMLYALVQFLEGWLITPMIQRRAVEIPPALIMLAQVTLALLLGALGLLLATPILAAILVVVRMIYLEDVLGDRGGEGRQKET